MDQTLSPRRKASLGFARRLQFGPWTCQNRSTKGAPDGQRGASNQVARFVHRHEAGFGDRNPGFFSAASAQRGERVTRVDEVTWAVHDAADQPLLRFTTNRAVAREAEGLDLLGLDHPCVTEALQAWRGLGAEALGRAVAGMTPALLAWWLVQTHGRKGEQRSLLVPLATSPRGERLPAVERVGDDWFRRGGRRASDEGRGAGVALPGAPGADVGAGAAAPPGGAGGGRLYGAAGGGDRGGGLTVAWG